MILDLKSDENALYIDNDKEPIEFYETFMHKGEYLSLWKESMQTLHSSATPIMLPVYAEKKPSSIHLQGYVIYPYRSAWLLIDRGVEVPIGINLSRSHRYVTPIEIELPENDTEWQSHWWLSGDDLTSLSAELGLSLQFQNGEIPAWPLHCRRLDTRVNIYADRQKFDINFVSLKSSSDIADYFIEQLQQYLIGNSSEASIPTSDVEDGSISILSLFRKNSYEYIALSHLDYPSTELNLQSINELLDNNPHPYVLDKDPDVYSYHARYTAGTATNLLKCVREIAS